MNETGRPSYGSGNYGMVRYYGLMEFVLGSDGVYDQMGGQVLSYTITKDCYDDRHRGLGLSVKMKTREGSVVRASDSKCSTGSFPDSEV